MACLSQLSPPALGKLMIPFRLGEPHRCEKALARSYTQKDVMDGLALPDTILRSCPGFGF